MENTTQIKNNCEDIVTLAAEKIKKEFAEFTGGQKEKTVSSYVSNVLQDFCKEDERFAEVIYKTKRTLADCCVDIMKGCGNAISDIDVYRKAVQFYFPNSEIEFKMEIHITGEAPTEEELAKEAETKPKEEKSGSKKSNKNVAKNDKNSKPKTEPEKTKAEEVKNTVTADPSKKKKKSTGNENTIQLTLF